MSGLRISQGSCPTFDNLSYADGRLERPAACGRIEPEGVYRTWDVTTPLELDLLVASVVVVRSL